MTNYSVNILNGSVNRRNQQYQEPVLYQIIGQVYIAITNNSQAKDNLNSIMIWKRKFATVF